MGYAIKSINKDVCLNLIKIIFIFHVFELSWSEMDEGGFKKQWKKCVKKDQSVKTVSSWEYSKSIEFTNDNLHDWLIDLPMLMSCYNFAGL